MWATAGEDLTLNFNFTFDGQFVLADNGSVKVTLRDNDGISVTDWNRAVQPDTGTTSIDLVIPAAINNIPSGKALESRYVRVEYSVNGKPCAKNLSYRLTPFIPLQASPAGVRNRLGATETELPDSDIDVHEAYYKLLPAFPEVLPAALTATDASCLAANHAIEIRAALIQMPALAAKLMQSESQDNASFTRMKLDLASLKDMLEEQLEAELSMMVEVSTGLIVSDNAGTMMVMTSPTNVITGA